MITGASAGIGRGLALRLTGDGARLFLTGRDRERLEAVAAECRDLGGHVETTEADLTEPAECRRVIDEAVERLGQVDMLICSAGVGMWARLEDVTDDAVFEHLVRVNYLSVVHLCRAALPHLRQTRGLIVGMSSLAGMAGIPKRAGYSASKFALTGFLEALRIEVKPDVDVLVVFPGMVGTGARAHGLGADGRPLGKSPRDESVRTMPIDVCVDLIIKAIKKGRRDLVMTAQGKVGRWLKLVAPRIVDRLAARSVREKIDRLPGDTPNH